MALTTRLLHVADCVAAFPGSPPSEATPPPSRQQWNLLDQEPQAQVGVIAVVALRNVVPLMALWPQLVMVQCSLARAGLLQLMHVQE